MHDSTKKYAERYGILGRLEALECDLLGIDGITEVDFDVSSYGEIPYVILVPEYKIDVSLENYYTVRKEQLERIINTCATHDLHPTGDSVEDMGQHWYIVRGCGKTWPRS